MARFTLAFILCFVSAALPKVLAADVIKVVTEEWPPYNYTDEKGDITGIATETLKAVLAEAEIDYEIEVLSWNRAYKLAKNNSHTLIYTIYRTDNRQADFQWICPIIETNGINIYALKSREDIKLTSLADAKRYVVGTTSRSVVYDFLTLQGFELDKNLDVASDESANIRKLVKGRIDLVIQEEIPFNLRVKNNGMLSSNFKKVFSLFAQQADLSCMAMSLSTPKELVDRIRSALVIVRARQQSLN